MFSREVIVSLMISEILVTLVSRWNLRISLISLINYVTLAGKSKDMAGEESKYYKL
jgi:ABC-type methionine transport system permease subunit